ncbi:MAG: hypothetical protein LH631_02995, partial [Alkalinema sp. CAN_BIN05]|nr:hypothetical protein [Alkalinema sp. CAN_BIN05]
APEGAIEQTLTYLKILLPKSSTDFQPKTPLGQKLWELRQRAIAEGMTLLSETELEQELADRRYGIAGMDTIHIVAAMAIDADEFVTTEKSTKPMFRIIELKMTSVVSLQKLE